MADHADRAGAEDDQREGNAQDIDADKGGDGDRNCDPLLQGMPPENTAGDAEDRLDDDRQHDRLHAEE